MAAWTKKIVCGVGAALALGGIVACDAILDVSSYKVAAASGDDGGPDAAECAANADCAAKGEYNVCRKSDGRCVSLLSPDCARVVGDYKDDNAILIGSLLPTAGPDQSSGLPIQNSIELAIEDFRSVGNVAPRPGSTARRPLVLVGCNDNSENETAIRAARHLANEVGVPAIIGAAFSGITIAVANEVTIPSGVLLISPSATSVAITQLADDGLVWRTSPSDVIQADAHAALFPLVEKHIKEATGGPGKINVAIAHKGDAYGSGLAQTLTTKLTMNGEPAIDIGNEPYFKVFNYGDPDDTTKPPDYATAISGVVARAPHVVYLFGTTETITQMMKGVEAQWAAPHRPFYLLADGALVSEVTDLINAAEPTGTLRERILGTVPGTSSQAFKTFRILYQSRVTDGTSPDIGGTANGYDALYNLAYAAVAIGDRPLTGANLKDGFAKLVPPAPLLAVGAQQINAAFQALAAGQSIDFAGASGPLDYDLTTGEAASDIQIWCVPLADGKAGAGRASSVFYDAAGAKLDGTFAALANDCQLAP
ncbi:MAG: ABC transporter substrate-binding protein [Labilithrix sp.]|nr:ABC transporter substrate-binding protein [Labilithrix sp.]